MRIFKWFQCVTIAVVLMISTVSFSYAQSQRFAILDMDQILSESSAGKSIQTQLKQKREAFQKEFATRENALVDAENKLIQERASLSPEEFDVKRKDFEKQLLETRNLFQKRRNDLDKGVSSALGVLREEIMKVTAAIAEEQKYSVVFTRNSVVIMDKELDITPLVLSKMNASFKAIPLKVSP